MGKIFQVLDQYLQSIQPNSVFVEIGSDRWEGSTKELDRVAGMYHTRLISVDILSNARRRLAGECHNTDFIVAKGSEWASRYSGPGIAALYLDNFDYIWNIKEIHESTEQQKQEYLARNEVLTNENSQIEHFRQMIHLYKYLDPGAIVAVDDTYQYNGCWVGKCGAVVVFLKANGWDIICKTLDSGIILTRTG